MLNKAIAIAAKAHNGQVDKGENPYILHPLRVMMNCESEATKICAVLHDVIEDTITTRIQNLSKEDEARIQKYKLAADLISDALPYADAIPDCRLVEINGVAEIHPAISSEQFCDMFIRLSKHTVGFSAVVLKI
ncbi:MAG: hypothetical protein DDT33_01292 [Firmicutes bacterium]|nr:hypothetical protein [Bacillota bacterium]